MPKLITFLKNSAGSVLGLVAGGVGGYIYFMNVGCESGACEITSNPYLTIIWGSLLGYLIGSTFNKTNKNKIKENEN